MEYHQAIAAFEALTMREAGTITRDEERTHQALLWHIANPNGPERYGHDE